jgi:branched-chain amino acid transport system permease protein
VTAAPWVETVLQAGAAGISIGAIYGLMCVGLALIFGVMRVINFAQGDLMMLGMYAAYYVLVALGVQAAFGNVLGPYAAIVIAAPVLYVFGYAVHRTLTTRS